MDEKTVNIFVIDREKVFNELRAGLKQHEDRLAKHSGHILVLSLLMAALMIGWQQQTNKLSMLEKRVQTIESKNNESVE